MDISKLLKIMSTDIHSLSLDEKLIGVFIVTIIAMTVVFIVLMLISFSIKFMNNLISKLEQDLILDKERINIENKDEGELIAVIAASIASHLNRSTSNIIIKNVVKVNENELNWVTAGRIEQMNKFH